MSAPERTAKHVNSSERHSADANSWAGRFRPTFLSHKTLFCPVSRWNVDLGISAFELHRQGHVLPTKRRSMEERRKLLRQRVLKSAKIVYNRDHSVVDC